MKKKCVWAIRFAIFFSVVIMLPAILPVHAGMISKNRPRVIVTTDGEDDDKASMVRFLLSSCEFEVEAIVNSCSEFHWAGGKGWNAFQSSDWIEHYIRLYGEVYDNLRLHDPNYPTPEYLLSKWRIGNISKVGEYEERTEGAKFIAEILLDRSDKRPIWLQAWGGCNTFAAALRIIEEDYPERMEEVAGKIRFFLIWEQDLSYQQYIRKHWERFCIPTIISDQFDCIAYIWPKVLPVQVKPYFEKSFMQKYILTDKGALCKVYKNNGGAYNAEGDSPAFLHCIDNGLRSMESPGYGGWGGRYVKVRKNVWMDSPPSDDYTTPEGVYGIATSWSKMMENWKSAEQVRVRDNYFKHIWRWVSDFQNDFAARADWCVKAYDEANHHPRTCLTGRLDRKVRAGKTVRLDASGSKDPDGDILTYKWYVYPEAGSYNGMEYLGNVLSCNSAFDFTVPHDIKEGQTIHVICEVCDNGSPALKSYIRVILTAK